MPDTKRRRARPRDFQTETPLALTSDSSAAGQYATCLSMKVIHGEKAGRLGARISRLHRAKRTKQSMRAEGPRIGKRRTYGLGAQH